MEQENQATEAVEQQQEAAQEVAEQSAPESQHQEQEAPQAAEQLTQTQQVNRYEEVAKQLEWAMDNVPGFQDEFKNAILKVQNNLSGHQTQQQFVQQQQQQIAPDYSNLSPDQLLGQIQQNVYNQVATELTAKENYNNYLNQFNSFVKQENLSDEDAKDFFQEAYQLASQMDQNALLKFNPKLVETAVNTVKKRWDRIASVRNKVYIENKSKDANIPQVSSGQGVKKLNNNLTRDDRVRMIAESLKAGNLT